MGEAAGLDMGEALGTEPLSNSSSIRHPPAGAQLAPDLGHTPAAAWARGGTQRARRGPDTNLSIPAGVACV